MIKIVCILNVLFMLRKWESKRFLGVYLSWIHCHFFIIHWKYTVQCFKRHSENSAFFNGMICTEPRAPVKISWNERNISKLKIAWEQFWRRWKLTLRLRFTPTLSLKILLTNLLHEYEEFILFTVSFISCSIIHSSYYQAVSEPTSCLIKYTIIKVGRLVIIYSESTIN